MKAVSTLPQNVAICVVYTIFSLSVFYIYKLAMKSKQAGHENKDKNPQQYEIQIKDKTLLLILGKTFLTKFTVGSILNKDKKYFLNQLLFFGVIGACCLHINHIIVWPCCLGFILIGVLSLIRQIGVILFKKYKIGDIIESEDVIMNSNHIQSNIQIVQVNETHNNIHHKKDTKEDKAQVEQISYKSWFQVLYLFVTAITALILMSYTIFTLSISVSNSGYLNLVSVLFIFVLDLAIRLSIISLTLTVFFIFNYAKILPLNTNPFIQYLCQDQIHIERQKIQSQMKKKALQITAAKQPFLKQETVDNDVEENLKQYKKKLFTQENNLNAIQQQQEQLDAVSINQNQDTTQNKENEGIVQLKREYQESDQKQNIINKNNQIEEINLDNYNYQLTTPQRELYQNKSQIFSSRVKTEKETNQTDRQNVAQKRHITKNQNKNQKEDLILTYQEDIQYFDYIENKDDPQTIKLSPEKQKKLKTISYNETIVPKNSNSKKKEKQLKGISPYFVNLEKELKYNGQNKRKRTKKNKQNFCTQNA